MSDIPDEAIEAGSLAIIKLDAMSASMGDISRAVVEAAAPIIRAQALAEAKARVEEETADPSAGSAIERVVVCAYNRAMDDAIAAIQEAGQ